MLNSRAKSVTHYVTLHINWKISSSKQSKDIVRDILCQFGVI